MKEYQRGKATLVGAPLTLSAGGTNGGTLDCIGASAAKFTIAFSAEANTDAVNPTVSVLACDNTTVSNFVTITADVQVDNASAGTYGVFVDKRNVQERYLRCVVTRETTTNGTLNCAVVGTTWRNEVSPDSSTEWDSLGAVAV